MAPSQSKQITIFGSTGPSGTALALAALNRGFTLVLYLRSPHKLAEQLKQGERVKVVVGNLDEEQKIKEAIQGKCPRSELLCDCFSGTGNPLLTHSGSFF